MPQAGFISQNYFIVEQKSFKLGEEKKSDNSRTEVSLDNYFKALASILKKFENDTQVQYHAFYSILNFISTMEINMDE